MWHYKMDKIGGSIKWRWWALWHLVIMGKELQFSVWVTDGDAIAKIDPAGGQVVLK